MTNKEIENSNSEKESTLNDPILAGKDKVISKKNTTQNKKVTSANKKLNKSFEEISNEIFSDLILRKDTLVKEIVDLETKKSQLNKTMFNNRYYVISAKEFSKAATIVLLFYSFLTFVLYTFS